MFLMTDSKWARWLAYVTGVNQKLLLQNEYLIAENRILRDVRPLCMPVHRRDRLGGLLKFYSRAA
jgi:hypothetical protein